jgi:hypothetical protein
LELELEDVEQRTHSVVHILLCTNKGLEELENHLLDTVMTMVCIADWFGMNKDGMALQETI